MGADSTKRNTAFQGTPQVTETALRGRQAEARRNDAAILAAARAVLMDDPDASIAAVVERAGVNVASLYRRFASKEDLLRRLCGDGLLTYAGIARRAVEHMERDDADVWQSFVRFMEEIVAADTHALTIRLAGRFRPTEEEQRNAAEAFRLNERLVRRAQEAGVLRDDIGPHDLSFVFEQVSNLKGATPERTAEIRARFLALQLDGLRAPARTPLPGPAATGEELRARWDPPPRRPPRG
jgi:AcrR family transcriptional regulator